MEAERARAEDLADRLGERPRNISFFLIDFIFDPCLILFHRKKLLLLVQLFISKRCIRIYIVDDEQEM